MHFVLMAVILLLAIGYGYLNGLHGSASIVATLISSRALNPRGALLLAAVGVTVGPFLFGVAVANTIGAKLISRDASTAAVVIAALVSTLMWSSLTLRLGIPSSISQTLVGSLLGAAWAGYGWRAILAGGLQTTLAGLFLSPVLGIVIGFVLIRLVYRLCVSATPHINGWFQRGQVLISFLMAMTFGANDSQKMMGVITLGLVATEYSDVFIVPTWVMILSAGAMGFGTWMGGWRLIRTLAGKFYKIRPIEGFGAQMTASLVILGAGLLGGPVSGSQVVTSAIVGVGSGDRIQKVRWLQVQRILMGWALTIPVSAGLSALIYSVIRMF